ncbi:MAG: GNAT family N-acetyltransferase [Pseudonocardia sp.]|nr:GNAT family N-acetyltransferase [Pseudonocardia sp.]
MTTTHGRRGTVRDWEQAAGLLAEHVRWVAEAVGLDLRDRQPGSLPELAAPEAFYHSPDGALVLAHVEGRPAGIVGVHRLTGDVGELKRMYVRPHARGLGVGRALVDEAVTAAEDLGFRELWLETDPVSMAGALRIYRDAGFSDIPPYGELGLGGVVTLGRALARSPATTP